MIVKVVRTFFLPECCAGFCGPQVQSENNKTAMLDSRKRQGIRNRKECFMFVLTKKLRLN